jgi:hypothetical protein
MWFVQIKGPKRGKSEKYLRATKRGTYNNTYLSGRKSWPPFKE